MSYPNQQRIFKVLDKIKSGKVKATELIDESASPIDTKAESEMWQTAIFPLNNSSSNNTILLGSTLKPPLSAHTWAGIRMIWRNWITF